MFIRGKKFLAVLLAIAVVGAPLTAPLAAPAEPTTAELSSLYTFDTNGGSAMYNVNLTANGDIDWFQLSRDSETSYAKKSGGAGLYGFYRNTDAAPGGGGGIAALGYINDGRINYTATDADPTLPAIVNRYGLTVRGVGNYLEFKIAESAQPRFLQVYSGNWSAQARIDYIVGGEVKWSRTFANGAHNAVYCATIYIEPNTEGAVRQTLTDMTSYGSSGGSTFLFAAALGAAPVIDKTNLAMKPGETETITATPGEGVVWSSSAPTVASVDQNGVVTAHRTGEAVITAALDGVQRQCAVTVISATAEVVAGGYVIDMADLPKVHFGDHPEWEEMYDASWQMHKSNIKKISGNGWNPDMPYYVDEAFSGYIYAWDTLFMMMFDKWGMNQFPTLAAMDNFYYSQTDSDGEDDGYIPREVSEADGIDAWAPNGGYRGIGYQDVRSMNPPLWAWAEWEQYMIHGDAARFGKVIRGKTIYERLKAHFAFIERYKKLDNGLYGKTNGYSNGLDNTFNQGAPYNGADPASDGGQTYNDLSLQQAQFAYYIAKIAGAVGNAAEQAYYEGEHARISALIREKMWDETAKMFSNLDRDQVTHTNVSTPTTLWALAAHVATEQQAGDLIKYHGGNSQKMFRPYGLSTAAYDDARYAPPGGYWQGSYWAPTSYQYIKGLGEYGYDTLAFEEALRHLTSVTGVYQATSTMWENYSADYLSRGSSSRSNFVGWTGCLSIGVILEDVLGVRLNAPDNIIDWNIRLTEEHGVSNLWMKHGGAVNRVSLLANERVSAKDPVTFTVTADCGVTLQVKNGAVTKTVDVEAGTHTYSIDGEAGAAPRLSIGRARDNAAFGQAALAASSDYVYFGQAADPSIFDGLTYQVRKGAGLITNVNTVGYSAASATNPPTYRAD
ncbi:MAG: Ig-like domain-containing protein, partial [Oscillospiraceae bacterium]|nr:Ig-like domain-containing protein [Oscillospiraceae bacterium]